MVFVLIHGNVESDFTMGSGLRGKNMGKVWEQYGTSTQDTASTFNGNKNNTVFRCKSIPVMTKHFIYQSISLNQTPREISTNHSSKLQSSKSSTKRLRISRKQSLKDGLLIKQNTMSIVQKDVYNLLQTLQKNKQQKDSIISTLRGKFSQAQNKMLKKNFTLQKSKPYILKKRYVNFRQQEHTLKQNQLNKMKTTCNTSYCNLDQQEMKSSNQNQYVSKSRALNLRIKCFKNQLKTFINSFLSLNTQHQQKHPNINRHNFLTRRLTKRNNLSRQHDVIDTQIDNLLQLSQEKILNKTSKLSNTVFSQYLYLAQKSYNQLEMLMKSGLAYKSCSDNSGGGDGVLLYQGEEISRLLSKIDKNLTLYTLRSTYKCLQPSFNSREITIKILLALGINPMNEFYLVSRETFSMFKRLSNNKSSRKQSREFLLRYFCYDHERIRKEQFDGCVYSLLKKLSCCGNEMTVERLYQEWREITREMLKLSVESDEINHIDTPILSRHNSPHLQQQPANISYTRSQIKSILTNDPLFLWQQILRLIFLV